MGICCCSLDLQINSHEAQVLQIEYASSANRKQPCQIVFRRWLPETQLASALGKRVWKSSSPTHSGVTVMRTMEEIIVRS